MYQRSLDSVCPTSTLIVIQVQIAVSLNGAKSESGEDATAQLATISGEGLTARMIARMVKGVRS